MLVTFLKISENVLLVTMESCLLFVEDDLFSGGGCLRELDLLFYSNGYALRAGKIR